MFTNYEEYLKSRTCCYLPQPPRVWYRVENVCYQSDNFLKDNELRVNELKGNILQYRKNSSFITASQRYSKIAKGEWTNRNTSWSSQSTRGYTNPNSNSLKIYGSINIAIDPITGAILGPTTLPTTCPSAINTNNEALPGNIGSDNSTPSVPPPINPSPESDSFPPITPDEPIDVLVISDGGSLICSIQENVCTGETKNFGRGKIVCHPTTDSDVPGPIQELCWNDSIPTWYPKTRLVMNNTVDKWPTNATLVTAIRDCKDLIP
jgi:hypothetical protein